MPATPTVSRCAFNRSDRPPPPPRLVAITLGRSSPTTSTSKPRPAHQSATNIASSRSPFPPGMSSGLTESIATSRAASSVSSALIDAGVEFRRVVSRSSRFPYVLASIAGRSRAETTGHRLEHGSSAVNIRVLSNGWKRSREGRAPAADYQIGERVRFLEPFVLRRRQDRQAREAQRLPVVCPRSTSPRQAPVSTPRLSTSSLNRSRLPLTLRSSWPIAPPSFSTMPSDSQSSWSMILQR